MAIPQTEKVKNEYLQYLKVKKTNKKDFITHTRIANKEMGIYGGVYNIPHEELPKFYRLYHEHVIINNNYEYLTEKQNIENGPILVDIDFRYNPDIQQRQHSSDHIKDIVYLYLRKMSEICNIEDGQEFPIYILEKDKVNVLDDKTKDGIHIIFGASCNKALQLLFRDAVIKDLVKLWDDLPFTNCIEDVIDLAIVKGYSNWQLYGSRKPGNKPYLLKYYYKCKFNLSDNDWTLNDWTFEEDTDNYHFDTNNFDNFELLSAQYTKFKRIKPKDEWIKKIENYKKETKQVNKKAIKNKNDETEKTFDDLKLKIVELISPKYLNNREDWLKIVFAMKREGFSQEDALRISNKATDCTTLTDNVWNETWNSEDQRGQGVSMGTLKHYAKLSQPLEYSLLFKENFLLDKITERSLASLFDALAGQNIVYCEEEKEFYCWYKSKWRIEDKEGSFIRTLLSQTLTEYFDKLIFNVRRDLNNCEGDDTSLKTKYEKLKEILKTVERTTWLNNIWKELQSIVKCKCEKLEFDTNPDLIAFNNKKYNFKTKEWSDIKYDDFVSMNTGKDWKEPTKEQLDCISKLFEEIFPNPEIRKSYLSILYNACIGGKKDKFVIANGKGGNGKGLINELVKFLLGDYAYEAPVSLLTREFRGGANPELANVHKKRFVLFKEPDATEKLFLGNVKTLVDNDSVNARQLYKGKCEITLNAIVCMETNVRLKFSGKPTEAETRRFMDILFESTFTENDNMLNDETLRNVYPMNKQYVTKEFQNEHRCALFQYIIDNAEKQIYNPKCVVERTKCYIEGEDTFANWYKENYDITGEKNDILKIKDMFEDYKESDDYKNMRKDERPNLHRFLHQYVLTDNKLSARYTETLQYRLEGKMKKQRSVLVGMKEKVEVDDELEEEVNVE